jgi:transcriptional regulator with XRE-family HTH domain
MSLATIAPSRIRLLRQEACLTTAELARRCGIGRSTLAKVELGYERCWPRLRAALARELSVSEELLFEAPL